MKKQQGGFTLVEIAIVLVIIGLLLGGVLKGQELINSAKVKNFANDFRDIPLFIYGYQDKYKAIPGDDRDAQGHLGASATQIALASAGGTAGNGRLDGNWWDGAASLTTSETVAFWQHVRLANLAAGPTTITADSHLPTNADGNRIGIEAGSTVAANQYVTGLAGTYVICSAGILGKFAKQLDVTMDDGEVATGSMRAVLGQPTARGNAAACSKAGAVAGCTTVDDSQSYTVCLAF